jgi:heterodisulfide reductase subunit A
VVTGPARFDTLIIGGGIAGLRCAGDLARLGLESAIVEKVPFFGGHTAHFCCKALDRCQRCGACLLEDMLDEVAVSDRIAMLPRTSVSLIERDNGLFRAVLVRRPPRIIPDKCNGCNACLDACPNPRALFRSPLDGRIMLDEEKCAFFTDGSCAACSDICPEHAIDLKGEPERVELKASSVVLACGFEAFDPRDKPRFGYGRVPGVITGLELETLLREDDLTIPGREGEPSSVAFIQCVGSRDPRIGRNYCSRVCCGYALRLARLLKTRFPGLEPAMFYMDIQSFDRDFEKRLADAQREVRLVRAIPSEIRTGEDGRPELIYQGPEDSRVAESFDMVTLSVGISPRGSSGIFRDLLGIDSNVEGFLGKDGEEVSTDISGVFVAGTVQGPRSIEETVSHACRAAGETAAYLARSRKGGK